MEIINAQITSTMLGIEDHGIMTFSLGVKWQGCGQSFGGYTLDGKGGEIGHAKSIIAIRRVIETVGVEKWEDIKGKYVRLKKVDNFGPIIAIGNIIDDKWFSLEEFFGG